MTEQEIIDLLKSYENDHNRVNYISEDDYHEIAKAIIKKFTESDKK